MMTDSTQSAFHIAWNFLKGTGEMEDERAATRVINYTIERLMAEGEQRPLMLANRAIKTYQMFKAQRRVAMAS